MVKPLKDRVLIRQDPPREKTAGGLYLPEVNNRVLQDDYGEVIAVGPKVLDVKVGDRVLFERVPSSALNPDTREGKTEWDNLIMIPEDKVIGVIE